MFIFLARNFHSRRIWYEKPAPENGVDLWRRFLERVSWVSDTTDDWAGATGQYNQWHGTFLTTLGFSPQPQYLPE